MLNKIHWIFTPTIQSNNSQIKSNPNRTQPKLNPIQSNPIETKYNAQFSCPPKTEHTRCFVFSISLEFYQPKFSSTPKIIVRFFIKFHKMRTTENVALFTDYLLLGCLNCYFSVEIPVRALVYVFQAIIATDDDDAALTAPFVATCIH